MGGFLTFLAHNLWFSCVSGLFVKLISDIIVTHECQDFLCAWFVTLRNSIFNWEQVHGQYQATGCFGVDLCSGRF